MPPPPCALLFGKANSLSLTAHFLGTREGKTAAALEFNKKMNARGVVRVVAELQQTRRASLATSLKIETLRRYRHVQRESVCVVCQGEALLAPLTRTPERLRPGSPVGLAFFLLFQACGIVAWGRRLRRRYLREILLTKTVIRDPLCVLPTERKPYVMSSEPDDSSETTTQRSARTRTVRSSTERDLSSRPAAKKAAGKSARREWARSCPQFLRSAPERALSSLRCKRKSNDAVSVKARLTRNAIALLKLPKHVVGQRRVRTSNTWRS